MKRVLIVSDSRLYREGLVRFLARDSRLEAVGSVGEWRAAELAIADTRPDVALVDRGMADAASAIRRLLNSFPGIKIVALGLTDEENEVLDWAEVGISGYVCREATLEDLVRAVESAVRDELNCSDRLAAALLRRVGTLATRLATSAGGGQLTEREREILRFLDRGLTNKQISSQLFIEVTTVKNHVHNILEKLGAQSRGEAAAKARLLGLTAFDHLAADRWALRGSLPP